MSGEMHARTLGEAIAKVRANWGWFVALGVGLLMLGVIAVANLLTATVASVLLVGVMIVMGGVAQIVLAFRVKTWAASSSGSSAASSMPSAAFWRS